MKRKQGQVYYSLDFHIIFSTKKRQIVIDNEKIMKIGNLIKKKCTELNIIYHIANGYFDHFHLLISVPSSMKISDMIKYLKGYSSFKMSDLFWKNGNYAFSVDESSFNRVFNYIKKQKEKHKDLDFMCEMKLLCR